VQQQRLFADADLPERSAYDPQEVRDKLQGFLDKMRAAASWPWKASTVSYNREAVWPSLLQKLPERDAVFFSVELNAEAARLDATD
jgi:hypothetical protein